MADDRQEELGERIAAAIEAEQKANASHTRAILDRLDEINAKLGVIVKHLPEKPKPDGDPGQPT